MLSAAQKALLSAEVVQLSPDITATLATVPKGSQNQELIFYTDSYQWKALYVTM